MTLANVPAARPDALEGELDDFVAIISDIEKARDEVVDRYNELKRAWEDSWGWWKRNVFSRGDHQEEQREIEGIWEKIEQTRFPEGEKVTGSILELSEQVINHHFPVVSLFRTSSRWVTETYNPTSQVYADIWSPEHSRGLAQWDASGEARGAYDEIREHQQRSVEAMVTIAGDISIWLSDVATGNVEFVTSMLSHLGGIASTIVEETGKIVNTGGVAVIWAAASAVGSAVEASLDVLGTLANNIALMATNIIEADRIIGNHSHFPDGDWPEAVTRP